MKKANMIRLRFIDSVSGLKIYETLQTLKKEQYLPAAQLDQLRQEKLEDLFTLAQQSTTYYAGFASFEEVPVLTKKIARQHPGGFQSRFYQDKMLKKTTGGTTGAPFVYYSSVNSQSALWAGLLLSWESAGYEFGDKVAFIAGSALIKSSTRHSIFYKLMNIDLYHASPLTDERIAQYLEGIAEKNTKLIYGYAMAINLIADHILANKLQPPPGLTGIVTTSEMLTDKMRQNIENAFGVKVFNQYGCNEAGIAAFECEHHRMHLINSRSVVATNEEGELIGTDLANDASIFLKFNTGDIVEFSGDTCNCGRHYPVISKILGRSDDVIIDRKNKRFHSSYFNFLFKTDPSIRQYQVFFDDKSIEINLKVDEKFDEDRYNSYLQTIKNNIDFEKYGLTINGAFYSGKNLKHAFIIDKRKLPSNAA